jgi:hypothetical protein
VGLRSLDVLGEHILRLGHQTLLLTGIALFPSSLVLLGLSATVTLPNEDNGLANQHTDGAGSETSQNTEDSRNEDEADNAREGVGKSTRRGTVVHVVRTVGALGIEVAVAVVTLGAFKVGEGHVVRALLAVMVTPWAFEVEVLIMVGVVGVALGAFFEFVERHALRAGLLIVMVVVGAMVRAMVTAEHIQQTLPALLAVTALGAILEAIHWARALTNKAILGMARETVNAIHNELLEALELAVAVARVPGLAFGVPLNLSCGDEQFAGVILDQSDSNGVNGDGVSLQVGDGEAHIDKVGGGLVRGGINEYDLDGVASENRASDFAIFGCLSDIDGRRGSRRENLETVG